ncbi:MAG TPA: prepilin-type N-terminal cleavage/methylation domain-containing protein [Phycisphaerales bacterium]|nr:prepilin-type N-terminal cleavage/methylation domain-containing protein [Phycisphaerales bacterium]
MMIRTGVLADFQGQQAPRRGCGSRRGFTFIDLMTAVAILSILVLLVAPTAQPDAQVKLLAASTRLAADIEYAQSMSLSAPADPTIVRVADNTSGYWLALKSTPDTPVAQPDGSGQYSVIFGQGDAKGLESVHVAIMSKAPMTTIEFDAFGRLPGGQNIVLNISNDAGSMYVRVAANTGSVSILGNLPSE